MYFVFRVYIFFNDRVYEKKCVDELECAFYTKALFENKGKWYWLSRDIFEKVISALKAFYFALILKLFKTVASWKMRSLKIWRKM